jgi:transposase-like protein
MADKKEKPKFMMGCRKCESSQLCEEITPAHLKTKDSASLVHMYRCTTCGHNWTVQTGGAFSERALF